MYTIIFDLSEMLMLICFGSSWPFAIVKTLRTKSVAGHSIVFLLFILAGYAFGIIYKFVNGPDAATWLYILNSSMILTEVGLYFKYRASTHDSTGKTSELFCAAACL